MVLQTFVSRHRNTGFETMTSVFYLDCSATAPLEPEVRNAMLPYLNEEFGNSGSRTHEFGVRANRAVEKARRQVAEVVASDPGEVIFTSGATESNNLAILGLKNFARESGRQHIVSTAIEHKAVLEPLEILKDAGFDVTLITPKANGRVEAADVVSAVRDDTLLVSVMHANNETGVIQPIVEISAGLVDSTVYFHTDAAQSYGKDIETLQDPRIDLISISGHKIFGPKGIGALIVRRRNGKRPPLTPLMFGGGQERGLRPGTMPVHLAVGLGAAAQIALRDHQERVDSCLQFREELIAGLKSLNPQVHGDPENTLPHVLNISFDDIDSEAVMLALKDEVAISNGSACTSASYSPCHVLKAMGLSDLEAETATRWSWCHLSRQPNWQRITEAINRLK